LDAGESLQSWQRVDLNGFIVVANQKSSASKVLRDAEGIVDRSTDGSMCKPSQQERDCSQVKKKKKKKKKKKTEIL
jgi:hypothetical protein